MKLTVTKSKNAACFYVQKSIRKDGKITTITIEKLGNLEQVKTKAKGQDPYEWARAYVDELNRKEYEEKKEIIARFAPSKLIKKGEQRAFNCGYLFLQSIFYQLKLDKICRTISKRHSFTYDLSDVLSRLLYTRILYPSSKLSSYQQSKKLLEGPSFELHDIYRALSVLAEESDYIQAELYKNSQKVIKRRKDVLYYDCTNYFFEIEEADDLRRYGKSKQHQPLPLVGMGLFMDHDGIPMAFDIYPGNQNEQPKLKPLEKKVLQDFDLGQVIVCTDAGLSSASNRKFNDLSRNGVQIRAFITTQSIKMLPDYLKEFSLSPEGWSLPGTGKVFDLRELDPDTDFDKIFYKDRWITEDLTAAEKVRGLKPLEQHLIVSFSLKYQAYLRKIRQRQVERAQKAIDQGGQLRKGKNQNDPMRFVAHQRMTDSGEVCTKDKPYLDTELITEEEKYDGFYAVCTNLDDTAVEEVIRINRKRWEIEECFRIMKTDFKARPVFLQREDRIKAHFLTCFIALMIYRILEKKLGEAFTCDQILDTLRSMVLGCPGEKQGYIPIYSRNDLTDLLHESFGFRTDYEILTDMSIKKLIRATKK